jgi:hypothetical protein
LRQILFLFLCRADKFFLDGFLLLAGLGMLAGQHAARRFASALLIITYAMAVWFILAWVFGPPKSAPPWHRMATAGFLYGLALLLANQMLFTRRADAFFDPTAALAAVPRETAGRPGLDSPRKPGFSWLLAKMGRDLVHHLSLILAVLGLLFTSWEVAWLRRAEFTTGEVTELKKVVQRSRFTGFSRRAGLSMPRGYAPVLRFQAHDGSEQTFRRELYTRQGSYAVGQRVPIAYHPRHLRGAHPLLARALRTPRGAVLLQLDHCGPALGALWPRKDFLSDPFRLFADLPG